MLLLLVDLKLKAPKDTSHSANFLILYKIISSYLPNFNFVSTNYKVQSKYNSLNEIKRPAKES